MAPNLTYPCLEEFDDVVVFEYLASLSRFLCLSAGLSDRIYSIFSHNKTALAGFNESRTGLPFHLWY